MNFLNLQYFLAVAEELNFTKAAQNLYISQQSLSRHIKNIEEEYDVLLFNRTQPLSLTPAGLSLQKNAQELIKIQEHAVQELNDIKSSISGELRVGVSITRGKFILPPVLSSFYKKFPQVNVKIFESSSRDLENYLLTGKIDLSLGFLPNAMSLVHSIPLYAEQVYAVIPKDILYKTYPDTADEIHSQLQEKFCLNIISKIPIISMPTTFKIGNFIQQLLSESDEKVSPILETTSVDTALALSMAGLGMCFAPIVFVPQEIQKKSFLYPLKHTDASYTISANYLKDRKTSKLIFEFISIAQNVLKN